MFHDVIDVRLMFRLDVLHFQVTYYSIVIKTVVVMFDRWDAVHDNLPYNISEL